VDDRARDLVNLGNKMFTTNDLGGARRAFESALHLDGHCAEAWHRRGRIFLAERDLPSALACYARSLELDPQSAEAWCAMGEAILAFLKADHEPLFIREHRMAIVAEALDCFERALKLGGDLPRAREGREVCRGMIQGSPGPLIHPRLFSFHSGGILEKSKRDVVSPFLKPSDYRRKNLPAPPE